MKTRLGSTSTTLIPECVYSLVVTRQSGEHPQQVSRSWDSFFLAGPTVSDVLVDRDSQEQSERDAFEALPGSVICSIPTSALR
jgi:hypothetical protein